MDTLITTAPTPPVSKVGPTFPALTYGHDAWGSNRFWIGVGPADPPICHVSYTVERVSGWVGSSRSEQPAGPRNAEGWAKLLAAAPEMAALLKAYEQWEGDLIINDRTWADGVPCPTQDQWDRLVELQHTRNSIFQKVEIR